MNFDFLDFCFCLKHHSFPPWVWSKMFGHHVHHISCNPSALRLSLLHLHITENFNRTTFPWGDPIMLTNIISILTRLTPTVGVKTNYLLNSMHFVVFVFVIRWGWQCMYIFYSYINVLNSLYGWKGKFIIWTTK